MTLSTDSPKYIFEGTNATTSQRATRATIEHWEKVKATGEDDLRGGEDASKIKRQHLKSSVGEALHLPKELLGDPYADPYVKKTHNLTQAGKSLSKAEVAALKEEVMQGWQQVAEDTGAMKSAFSAMKDTSTAPLAPVPQITNAAPAGHQQSQNKPEYTVAEKTELAKTAANRALPSTKYGDCNASVPANGALRNEAFTSLW